MKVMHDQDIQPGVLNGKRVAIIGYGSQGHAHALNLRDSGCDVVVGLRPEGKSWTAAQHAGLTVSPVAEAVAQADVVMILIPDEQQPATYEREIAPYLKRGAYLAFAHGFCIHFKRIQPPADANVFLVAPKGPGRLVRRQYEAHAGVPCLIAIQQDPAGNTRDIALAYAGAIGGGRAGIIETSFREETETDLFGEQAVLCGGLSELVRAGFETLVAAGYAPEMAYFECLHEVKLITDLMYERGITGMRQAISNTAKYGDVTRGRRIVNEQTRQEMQRILAEIQSGKFADEWMDENAAGQPKLRERMQQDSEHQVEQVGRALRGMMPWLTGAHAPSASAGPAAQNVPAGGHVTRLPESTGPRLRPAATSAPRASAANRPASPQPGVHTRHDGLVDPSSSWPGFEAPPSWYLNKPETGPTQG